jgi:hypothetical protein
MSPISQTPTGNNDRRLEPEEALVTVLVATIATLTARGDGDYAAERLGQYFEAEGLFVPDDMTESDAPGIAESLANSFTLWAAVSTGRPQ